MIRICMIFAVSCMLGAPLAVAQKSDKDKAFKPTEAELKILELTNAERKKKDLRPLKLNLVLCKIARKHSENMASQGKMEHKLDKKTPGDRTRDAGYKFMRVGENIAFSDPEAPLADLVQAWMDSERHRANILHTEYLEIGIGIAPDKEGTLYFTQLFARPQ